MFFLNHKCLVVLFIRSAGSTRLHFFYIGHLLWNQLESSRFGLLLFLASAELELIPGAVRFFHVHPSGFLDLLGHESARLELIHYRPSPRISSSRADSGLEGYKVYSSQILGFQLYTQFCATPIYAVRVRTKCPYYLDIATCEPN